MLFYADSRPMLTSSLIQRLTDEEMPAALEHELALFYRDMTVETYGMCACVRVCVHACECGRACVRVRARACVCVCGPRQWKRCSAYCGILTRNLAASQLTPALNCFATLLSPLT